MTDALKFDSHHGTWRPFRGDLPGQSRRLGLGTPSTTFGAGFTRIERSCRLGITLKGDQIVYIISGEFQVIQPDAAALVAHAGDALLLRNGASLSIGIVGHCHFFYVLSPDMDWRSTLEPHT
jgi:ethanolamine utilization protein EutQ (cupin superfamily)